VTTAGDPDNARNQSARNCAGRSKDADDVVQRFVFLLRRNKWRLKIAFTFNAEDEMRDA